MSYIQKIVDYFFHHSVSPSIAKRVQERMILPQTSKECDEALARIWEETKDTVYTDPQIDKAFARLEHSMAGKAQRMQPEKNKRNWLQIAAIWTIPFLMLCSSGYFYYQAAYLSPARQAASISYIQCYAKAGTREQITLPDGSNVWLNSGSLLIYPSTFQTSERSVYLSGEGFFEVRKDAEHPFTVNTNYMQLEVLGTSFNISAYPDNEQTQATLETGMLKINVCNDSINYFLKPDNQLVYTPATGVVETHKVHAADFSDWRSGGLLFNGTPLKEVLRTLERIYAIRIHLQNSIYREQKLRIHFNKNETLENVLRMIQIMTPGLEYQIDGKEVYLK